MIINIVLLKFIFQEFDKTLFLNSQGGIIIVEDVRFINNQSSNKYDDKLVNECFNLRHRVFHKRLNWQVSSYGRQEIDVFDHNRTWYAALENENHQVVGTWRALPTTGDYMLKNVFPEMARGEPLPRSEKIWEISRFAIDKEQRTIPSPGEYICDESKALIKSFYEFSHKHGIEELVTVTSVAAERMLKRLDVKLRRLGDGRSKRIGTVQTTAVLIDIPDR